MPNMQFTISKEEVKNPTSNHKLGMSSPLYGNPNSRWRSICSDAFSYPPPRQKVYYEIIKSFIPILNTKYYIYSVWSSVWSQSGMLYFSNHGSLSTHTSITQIPVKYCCWFCKQLGKDIIWRNEKIDRKLQQLIIFSPSLSHVQLSQKMPCL